MSVFKGSVLLVVALTCKMAYGQISAKEIMHRSLSLKQSTYFSAEITMTLINRQKTRRYKKMKSYSSSLNSTTKTVSFFTAPSNVVGTAFLSIKEKDSDASRWMYLPAVKKTKRMGTSESKESFMGSDFTYADLSQVDSKKYNFKKLPDVKDKEASYYVIEARAKSQTEKNRSGYKKTIHYVRKDNFLITRSIFFAEDEKLMKFLKVSRFETVNGILIPTQSIMVSKVSGKFHHKTIMTMTNIDNKTKLPQSLFTQRSLEKGI